MVEKDIEVSEREITEMEEEFLNIEKLQADGYNEAEGPRYLSIFRPPSLSTTPIAVSMSCVSRVL